MAMQMKDIERPNALVPGTGIDTKAITKCWIVESFLQRLPQGHLSRL